MRSSPLQASLASGYLRDHASYEEIAEQLPIYRERSRCSDPFVRLYNNGENTLLRRAGPYEA